jgi:hypothetical protein
MKPPPEKVADAMPGTLAELSFITGYPVGEVAKQINNLRRAGRHVNAVPDPTGIGVRWPIETDVLSTTFTLGDAAGVDEPSREE